MALADDIEILRTSADQAEKDKAAQRIQDEYDRQRKKTADLEKDISKEKRNQSAESKKQLEIQQETNNVIEYVWATQKKVLYDSVDWLKNTKQQYLYSQTVAEQYKKLGKEIGLGSQQSKYFKQNFKESLPYFAKLGLEASNLNELLGEFMDSSGRIIFFSEEEKERMADLVVGLGLSEQNVAKLSERFNLMGVGIESMYDNLNKVYSDSQKLGLNAQKVIEVVSQNFESMQRMSFKGGVKAMTEMSKLAVKMKMDVSSMLSMADKFYSPEAAIEASAELQLMGGDIAKAFGDPLKLMYEARNAPEELAKRIGEATENMVQLNEKTGEYELPPASRQQLMFMADKLGKGKDEVIDIAFQMSKLKDIKEAIGSGDMFSEDEQEAIAGMSKFKGGKWVVDFGGQSIDISDSGKLKQAISEGMLTTKPEDDAIKSIAESSFTTEQIAKNQLEELKAQTQLQIDFYAAFEAGLIEPQKELGKILPGLVTGMGSLLKNPALVGEGLADFMGDPEKYAKIVGNEIAGALKILNTSIEALFAGNLNTLDNIEDVLESLKKGETPIDENAETPITVDKPLDGILGPGSNLLKRPKGSMSATIIQPDVNDYAFFIQKDKVKNRENVTTTNNNNNSTTTLAGTATINVNIKSDNPSLDISSIKDDITRTVTAMFNNGGSPDGANLPQPSRGFGQLI